MTLTNPYFVYILTNQAHARFYVGSTANLEKRVAWHRGRALASRAPADRCYKLVHFERHEYMYRAFIAEARLKSESARDLHCLISVLNPQWRDLDCRFLHDDPWIDSGETGGEAHVNKVTTSSDRDKKAVEGPKRHVRIPQASGK